MCDNTHLSLKNIAAVLKSASVEGSKKSVNSFYSAQSTRSLTYLAGLDFSSPANDVLESHCRLLWIFEYIY